MVSSKVDTLHPEPNTLLGYVQRKILFLTNRPLGRQVLYKHYLGNSFTGFYLGRHLEESSLFFFSACLSSSSVSLEALLGGRSHTVLV